MLKDFWEKHDTRWITRQPTDEKEMRTEASLGGKSSEAWSEEFLTLNYINFIVRTLVHIRWLVLSAAGMFVLLLLSATLYPFEPQRSIHAFFTAVFLGMFSTVAVILAEMHKDAILSYLTDTTPGELGADFYFRILTFSAIPIFSLVSAQVPQLNHFIFSWVKPILNGLGKG